MILAESVRLSSCFSAVSVSSEVHQDVIIQSLRWHTSQAFSQRLSSIFTCEQDLRTKSNKWGASHLPLELLFSAGDVIVVLWASRDPFLLCLCGSSPFLSLSITHIKSAPKQLNRRSYFRKGLLGGTAAVN